MNRIMAEGFFDGRYRYDLIYPRGRSGETLRGVDTLHNDRPIVIKRPAPHDAPPIRAGQEVSIRNERDALRALAGHPVLTEWVGEGHFMIGGVSYQYIVMERATGDIVEETVLRLAETGKRLPLLEVLVIVDNLLDLLQTAHTRDIIYNDVDSKHLFWNRDTYQLKVIDWGNAVFLEGDEITPQGISRQTDVFQVGELLYFIVSGGKRPEIPRDAGEGFEVALDDLNSYLPIGLRQVISKALHPNHRLRYPHLKALREALLTIRKPLLDERDRILEQIRQQLQRENSRDELLELQQALIPALEADPGNPPSRALQEQLQQRLTDLQVSADLDAAIIYLTSANWHRAADILGELRQRATSDALHNSVRLFYDWCILLLENEEVQATSALQEAIQLILENKAERAAQRLLMPLPPNDATRRLHILLAERITSSFTEVVLLRPNLFRLDEALTKLSGVDGIRLDGHRELMDEILGMLEGMNNLTNVSASQLRDLYHTVVDHLNAMRNIMEAINIGLSDRRLPLSSLDRARYAAMNLTDNMHIIGKEAISRPPVALAALEANRLMDPFPPVWNALYDMLSNLYKHLQSYQVYVPMADASDLEMWLDRSLLQLQPYSERVFDELLAKMINGLVRSRRQWKLFEVSVTLGNRTATLSALAQMEEALTTLSPTLAGWLQHLSATISRAEYVERHALAGGFGRTVADAWNAFDRGRLVEAERLALQASQIASSDAQKQSVHRLKSLAETARSWQERNGALSAERTQQAINALAELYLPEEAQIRDGFERQMPSQATYLKAMGKGLVEPYARQSTAAVRMLFFDFILQGTLEAQSNELDNSQFWQQAALQTLDPHSQTHPLMVALRDLIQRNINLSAIATLFNGINHASKLDALGDIRRQIEAYPEARLVDEAIRSLRELENALPEWVNGEFRTAGLRLENAIHAVQHTEEAVGISLGQYKQWLNQLQASLATLHTLRRRLNELIESKPNEPIDEVANLHERMLNETVQMLGRAYANNFVVWYDTYQRFVAIFADGSQRRSAKLVAFSEQFRALFIDRQPAYPLFRHWFDLIERAPEFPPPPTDAPQPTLTEADENATIWVMDAGRATPPAMSRYGDVTEGQASSSQRTGVSLPVMVVGGLVVVAVGLLLFYLFTRFTLPQAVVVAVTISPTPSEDTTATAWANSTLTQVAQSVVSSTATDVPPTLSSDLTATLDAFSTLNAQFEATATAIKGQATPIVPLATDVPLPTVTPTFTPSITPTSSLTPPPTLTATPVLAPQGVQGEVQVFDLVRRIQQENLSPPFWDVNRLMPEGTGWRFGMGATSDQPIYALAIPPDVLASYYGETASTRLDALEITAVLTTFNPNLLATNEVFYGILLAPVDEGGVVNLAQAIGIQINLVEAGIVNIAQRNGEALTVISQRSIGAVITRLRLDVIDQSGAVRVQLNGAPIGADMTPIYDSGRPVVPVVFVKDGGVILNISDWRMNFR